MNECFLFVHVFSDKPIVSEYRQLRPSPNDFSFLRVIGRGQFGTVTLNRENASGQCFAIKTIKKGSPDIAKQTIIERQALALASQSNIFWFPKLHMAIQVIHNTRINTYIYVFLDLT